VHIERICDDGKHKNKTLKHEGFFIDHRETNLNGSNQIIFQAITRVIDRRNWHVVVKEDNSRIIVCDENLRFGNQWIEWRVDRNRLSQTIFFSPRGLPGFLYWYLLYPIHWLTCRGLIRNILEQSEKQ